MKKYLKKNIFYFIFLYYRCKQKKYAQNTKMNNFKVSIYNEKNKKMNGLILKIGGN